MADLTTYLSIRNQIKTGDLLAVSGNGLISKVIRIVTKSIYSHVGLLVRFSLPSDRIFVLHATRKLGVTLLPVSRYLSQIKAQAFWVPLHHSDALIANPNYQENIMSFSLLQLGRAYDTKGVLRFLFSFIPQTEASYFCSEIAARAYREARLMDKDFVSPGELVERAIFRFPTSLN